MMSVAGALGLAIAEASGRQVDFDVYRMSAAHVLGPHLYDVRLTRLNLPFTYPPFAALLFWPFAAADLGHRGARPVPGPPAQPGPVNIGFWAGQLPHRPALPWNGKPLPISGNDRSDWAGG